MLQNGKEIDIASEIISKLKQKGIQASREEVELQVFLLQEQFPSSLVSEEKLVEMVIEEILKEKSCGATETVEKQAERRRENGFNAITQVINLQRKDNELRFEQATQGTLPYLNVYQWACRLTTEQGEDKFFWTPATLSLLYRLKNTEGNLIAVIGLQGTGKTALRQALEFELINSGCRVYSFKWLGNPKETINRVIATRETGFLDRYDSKYFIQLFDEFLDTCASSRTEDLIFEICKKLHLSIQRRTELRELIENYRKQDGLASEMRIRYGFLIPALERRLGRKIVQEIQRNLLLDYLQTAHTVLIDLPDYGRGNIHQMSRDLAEIQRWWEQIFVESGEGYKQKVNLVLFFQKELFHGHFFMGKLSVFELKPLSTKQLLLCYKQNFGSFAPFTQKALLEIANLSRGIFRRFKKYISICLEHFYQLESCNIITHDNVKQWIALRQLEEDMELELMTIFPKEKELRRKCVILLRQLREAREIPQRKIVEELFDGAKMRCSRFLERLESWGYIKRERKGNEKVVKLP